MPAPLAHVGQVFPDGTRSSAEAAGRCSVRSILVRSDQGGNEVLRSSDLLKLEPGAPVYEGLLPRIAGPLPLPFPKDCWYLPGLNRHWSNNLDE